MITSVAITKRLMDVVISVLAMVIISPFWLAIAILIKLDSPGPIFYKQKRLKRVVDSSNVTDSDMFDIYKFRTMCENAEAATGAIHAVKGDSRITRVGKILRLTRLDELPNFINVLKGDMSVIGPRPERLELQRTIEHLFPIIWKRNDFAKPGITGLAQISLKSDGSMESKNHRLLSIIPISDKFAEDIGIAAAFRYKLYYDFSYVCQLGSFWTFLVTDLKIIILTPVVMFFKRNVI